MQFIGAVSDRILQTIIASRQANRVDLIAPAVGAEHAALREAIAARDPVRARAAMRAHMEGSAARISLRLAFYS